MRSLLKGIPPGKRIRILENFDYPLDDFTHITQVVATKGSIGTILSYREYIAHQEESARRNGYFVPQHHREWIYSGIEAGTHYPIRLDEVVPLSDDDYATLKEQYDIVSVLCEVGALTLLPTTSFAVI
jgi:hypothetical protein